MKYLLNTVSIHCEHKCSRTQNGRVVGILEIIYLNVLILCLRIWRPEGKAMYSSSHDTVVTVGKTAVDVFGSFLFLLCPSPFGLL